MTTPMSTTYRASTVEPRPRIRFRRVSHKFRLVHERPETLRELFISSFRSRSRAQNFEALKGISFDVLEGETLGIIGRNGAGKSTILKLMAKVYRPTSGLVAIDGQVSALIDIGAGFHPELTGRENIFLSGALLGFSRREMRARFEHILCFADIGEFIDTPVRQYSTGMYMRLAFAIVAEMDANILLIDEILAVGDESFQKKCLERLRELRQKRWTIVIVSHDLAAIQQMCDRVMLLDQGKILWLGEPARAIARYQELLSRRVAQPTTTVGSA